MYLSCMNFMRCSLLALFFFTILISSADAQTADERFINWQTPPDCGSTEGIQLGFREILGDASPSESGSQISGSIVEREGKWIVTLEAAVDDKTFTRTVNVNTCEAALEVSALLIALQLNPTAVLASDNPAVQSSIDTLNAAAEPVTSAPQAEEETSDPPAATAPIPAATPILLPEVPQKPVQATPPRDTPLSFQTGLSFAADVGTVGDFAPGLSVHGGMKRQVFAAEIAVRYLPPRDMPAGGAADAVWSPQLVGFSLGVGSFFAVNRFRLAPLIGLSLHGIFAASKNVRQTEKENVWIGSAWIGLTLEWQIVDWFGIRLQPTLHYMFTRPIFYIEGIDPVYQTSPAAGIFTLGFFFTFR